MLPFQPPTPSPEIQGDSPKSCTFSGRVNPFTPENSSTTLTLHASPNTPSTWQSMPSQVSVISTSGTVYRSSSVDGYETSFPNISCRNPSHLPVRCTAVCRCCFSGFLVQRRQDTAADSTSGNFRRPANLRHILSGDIQVRKNLKQVPFAHSHIPFL